MKYLTKYFGTILLIVILIVTTQIINYKIINKPVELYDVKLKEGVIKNTSFAIMIEKEDETGYEQYTNSNWPTIGYLFNEELSGCTNSNGEALENALTYNYSNYSVNVKTNGKTNCFMYFDFLYNGEGTEVNPYKIEVIEDLVDLSNAVNKGITYSGNYFSLTKTLDFNDTTSYEDSTRLDYKDINGNGVVEELLTELTTESGFKPIGTTVNIVFSGIFNGNENKIENLYIKNETTAIGGVGLFGRMNNATISNLGVSGNISSSVVLDVGGIVGVGINVTINNCYNEANVTSSVGSYSVGGIIGNSYGTSTINNSYNKGNISNGNNTGGIAGYNGGTLNLNNSYNEGTITNNLGTQIGGLIGRDNAVDNETNIINSYNNGQVLTEIDIDNKARSSGGLIGKVTGNILIEDSYNSNIVSNSASTCQYTVSVAGLIGRIAGDNTIKKIINSYNTGNINGGIRAAGLIGYDDCQNTVIIDKSYNLGSISTSAIHDSYLKIASGLFAYPNSAINLSILNSYNAGEINNTPMESYEFSGGLVGVINSGTNLKLINSYNSGKVHNDTDFAAGITNLGSNQINNLYLNNVYNVGDVSATYSYNLIYDATGNNTSTNNTNTINNAYYLNTGIASDMIDIISASTSMTETEIKSETFVNTLNSNISSINLESIDSNLKDYTLSTWKLGTSGYPVLSYQE